MRGMKGILAAKVHSNASMTTTAATAKSKWLATATSVRPGQHKLTQPHCFAVAEDDAEQHLSTLIVQLLLGVMRQVVRPSEGRDGPTLTCCKLLHALMPMPRPPLWRLVASDICQQGDAMTESCWPRCILAFRISHCLHAIAECASYQ